MSRDLGLAGAAVAAALAAAGPAAAQGPAAPAAPPGLPTVPVTKVIAIGHVTERWTPEAIRTVMPREVRETVELYLQGRIEQWFVRKDQPGVVFVFNSSHTSEVHDLLEALPLGRAKMMTFDLIPLGPLAPLGLLTLSKAEPRAGQHREIDPQADIQSRCGCSRNRTSVHARARAPSCMRRRKNLRAFASDAYLFHDRHGTQTRSP